MLAMANSYKAAPVLRVIIDHPRSFKWQRIASLHHDDAAVPSPNSYALSASRNLSTRYAARETTAAPRAPAGSAVWWQVKGWMLDRSFRLEMGADLLMVEALKQDWWGNGIGRHEA